MVAGDPEDLLRGLGVATTLRGGEGHGELHESAGECAVLRVLGGGPRPADLVQREARLTRGAYLQAVFSLTLRGVVRSLPGDLLALGEISR